MLCDKNKKEHNKSQKQNVVQAKFQQLQHFPKPGELNISSIKFLIKVSESHS